MNAAILKLLRDPAAIWEAMSADGITYPFDDNRVGLSESDRQDLQDKINGYDDAVAMSIGDLIAAHGEAHEFGQLAVDAALGEIVRKQILGHLERMPESEGLLTNSHFSDMPEFPKFKEVSCSSCGESFGAGNSGFSHCDNHAGMRAKP